MKKCPSCLWENEDSAERCIRCKAILGNSPNGMVRCKVCGGAARKKVVSGGLLGLLLIIFGLLESENSECLLIIAAGLIIGTRFKSYWVCKDCESIISERMRKWYEIM
jgi:hypothetical protein